MKARNLALAGYAKDVFHALNGALYPLSKAREEALTVMDHDAVAKTDDWLVQLRDFTGEIAQAMAKWDGSAATANAQQRARAAALATEHTTTEKEGVRS